MNTRRGLFGLMAGAASALAVPVQERRPRQAVELEAPLSVSNGGLGGSVNVVGHRIYLNGRYVGETRDLRVVRKGTVTQIVATAEIGA